MLLASFRDTELRLLHTITCELRGRFADGLADFVNDVVPGAAFFVLLFLLSAVTKRGRARFPRVVVTLLLAMGFVHGVREAIWRTMPRLRPGSTFADEQILSGPIARETCDAHPELWVERGYRPKSPSFPSSHVVTGGACAIALTYANPWLGAAAWLWAVFEGWGRLYWGKHWPSDIAGSLVLAVLLGMLAWRLAPRVLADLSRRRRPPAAPPPPVPPGTHASSTGDSSSDVGGASR